MKLKHFLMAALCAAVLIPVLTLPGCKKEDEVNLQVKMDKSSTTIVVGASERLDYTVTPSGESVSSVLWETSDASVATVSSAGLVTGVKAGTATVTVTVNGKAKGTCTVTVTDPVPVPGIEVKLDADIVNLPIGEEEKLEFTLNPADAPVVSTVWTSSDTSIATVSAAGLVTGVKLGTARIVLTVNGMASDTCKVTVKEPTPEPEIYVNLNKSAMDVVIGTEETLDFTVTPAGTKVTSTVWTSSNENVATVSSKGVVKGLETGTAQIVLTVNGVASDTCKVTVKEPTPEPEIFVALNKTAMEVVTGAQEALDFTVTPAGTKVTSTVWTSGNTAVATVSSNGIVKGIETGTAQIVLTVNGVASDTCTVTVKEPTPEPQIQVKLSASEMKVTIGKTARLEYTIEPSTTAVTSTLWESSEPSVATVSASGLVTGVTVGTTVIKLTVNGKASATCTVTIEPLKNGMEDFGDGGDASNLFN